MSLYRTYCRSLNRGSFNDYEYTLCMTTPGHPLLSQVNTFCPVIHPCHPVRSTPLTTPFRPLTQDENSIRSKTSDPSFYFTILALEPLVCFLSEFSTGNQNINLVKDITCNGELKHMGVGEVKIDKVEDEQALRQKGSHKFSRGSWM